MRINAPLNAVRAESRSTCACICCSCIPFCCTALRSTRFPRTTVPRLYTLSICTAIPDSTKSVCPASAVFMLKALFSNCNLPARISQGWLPDGSVTGVPDDCSVPICMSHQAPPTATASISTDCSPNKTFPPVSEPSFIPAPR